MNQAAIGCGGVLVACIARRLRFCTAAVIKNSSFAPVRDRKHPDLWAFLRGVTPDFSRLRKPTDNAYIESLNGKFRAECLNANWFMSLDEARRKCEA